MRQHYDLRKIYTLLVQGFTEDALRNICEQDPEFQAICDQLMPFSSKDDIIRQIFEYARQTSQFGHLLDWAKAQNPTQYASLEPYYDETESTDEYLGQYRIIERLAHSGMADVYKAEQTELNRHVAIKAIHSHLANEAGFIERFRQEAAAMTSLRHPNIMQVYDFFTMGNTHYIVMKYIDGRTLEDELYRYKFNEKTFDLDDTVRIFNDLAGALDYAHQQGIIHRNLKPGNILFTTGRQLMLTDFGVARIIGATRYTMTGAVASTAVYVSPEQAQGHPGDARSDTYALGAILFEMVTGHALFAGDTSVAVLLKQVTEPPPRPTALNPDLPQAVENVILKALNKNPRDRFQSAGEMARALKKAVASASGNPIPSTGPLSPERAVKSLAQTTPLPYHTNIFISYDRNVDPDEAIAMYIFQVLSQDHHVFIDQTIVGDERWVERIESELSRANFLIAILSPQSIHSEMIQAEITRAHRLAQQKGGNPAILPVRLDYNQPFPYPLSAYLDPLNWAYWQSPADTPRLLEELTAAIDGVFLPIDDQGKSKLLQNSSRATLATPPPSAQPPGTSRLEMPAGTPAPPSKFYIERPGDSMALDAIQREGVTITIKAPRQTGKSSLLWRIMDAAANNQKRVVFFDFQVFNSSALVNADTFFRQFCRRLGDELEIDDRTDNFWNQPLGHAQRCTRYMGRYLLKQLDGPVLLAMDEVDAIFGTDFYSDFFGMLRSWHNNRRAGSAWKHLDLALVTATEPYQFIKNLHQSPFNVSEIIELADFNADQVADLNRRHGSPLNATEEEQLMVLLGGHPYLTRRALYLVAKQRVTIDELVRRATDDNGPFGDHLRHYSFRLHGQPDLIAGMRHVIQHNTCPDERIFSRLHGAGLVCRPDGGMVLPRCQLYANYFGTRLEDG